MAQIRLTEITPHVTKTGKTMFFLKDDQGNKYSTFDVMENVKIGDVVTGEITESNGYKNFKLPRTNSPVFEKINDLDSRVSELEKAMKVVAKTLRDPDHDCHKGPEDACPVCDVDDIDPADIPF
jgi:hypothetical protein